MGKLVVGFVFSQVEFVAVDIPKEAVELTVENARKNDPLMCSRRPHSGPVGIELVGMCTCVRDLCAIVSNTQPLGFL
jgi:hypothetical protein